jgi:hypothetical protein
MGTTEVLVASADAIDLARSGTSCRRVIFAD